MARLKSQHTIRTIKFLSCCKDPTIIKQLLHRANKQVVKGICNAAYNITEGDLPLSQKQKRLFRKGRPVFQFLTSKKQSLSGKQKRIQRGGSPILAALIPVILSTVLSTVGSALFKQ